MLPLPIFLTSAAILVIEVFYTRLFSILMWSNMASAVLSLALLGIGSSGLAVYLFPARFRREQAESQIAWMLPATGVLLLVSYLAILRYTAVPYDAWPPVIGLVLLIVIAMLPYFGGGLVLAIAFTHFAGQIAKLYFWDLIGAALGAALVVPLLYACNGPTLVPAVGVALALGGALYAFTQKRRRIMAASLAVAALLSSFNALPVLRGLLEVRYAKGVPTPNILRERWDPVARITLTPGDERTKFLTMDGGAVTAVLKFDGNLDRLAFLEGSVLQLAYHLRKYDSSLIIGPGGGGDVLSSILFGNRNITAVEVNRSTLDLLRNDLKEYTGGLYQRPEVDFQLGEGRAFIASGRRRFDLIQATFIDTWAAASTGSHTLSEDYLYTVEGVGSFLRHLNADGVFSVSRWGGPRFGYLETYRIVAIANAALEKMGATDPSRHVIVIQGPPSDKAVEGGEYAVGGSMDSMATILVKRSPFTQEEIEKMELVSREFSFRPLWLAGKGSDHTITELFARHGEPSFFEEAYERTGLDFSPTSDDRPFFFDMVRPHDYFRLKDKLPGKWEYGRMYTGIKVLYQMILAMFLVVIALLLVPLVFRSRGVGFSWSVARVLGYFICLGLGFIGIELGLIQKFALFLGHPVYSLVVLLASILFFSGVGSFTAQRATPGTGVRRAAMLVGVLVLYAFLVTPLTTALIGSAFVWKCAIAVALSAVPAFFMGGFFPLGVALIRDRHPQLIPWAWAVNSGFSVLGGTLSLFASMSWGYTLNWFAFTAAYAVAALLLMRMARDTV